MITMTSQGQGNHSNQGQPEIDGQHHNNHANNGDYRGNQLGQTLLQGSADVINIVGYPA